MANLRSRVAQKYVVLCCGSVCCVMWGSSSFIIVYCIIMWWWQDSTVVLTSRLRCRWVQIFYIPGGVCRCWLRAVEINLCGWGMYSSCSIIYIVRGLYGLWFCCLWSGLNEID